MSAPDRIAQAMSATAVGFGLASAAAPQPFGNAFGFRASDPETQHVTRLWGTRMAALGALGLATANGPQRRAFLATVAAMNLADVVLGLRAPGLSAGARRRQVVTSAAFAALGSAVLAAGD